MVEGEFSVATETRNARGAGAPRGASFSLSDPMVRAAFYQVVVVGAVILVGWYLISNTLDNLSAGMPSPVSFTRTLTVSPLSQQLIAIVPPGSVNLIAFERRLSMICLTFSPSAHTVRVGSQPV